MTDQWDRREDLSPRERAQMRALEAREKGETRTPHEELYLAMAAARARCRSCKGLIVWALTAPAAPKVGKRMPLDLVKADAPGPSQFDLKVIEGELRAIYISAFEQGYRRDRGESGGYVSHFSTCPQASSHRKSRGSNA